MSPSLILSLSLAWLNLPLLDFAQLSFFAVKSDIAESCTAKSVIAEFLAAESLWLRFSQKSLVSLSLPWLILLLTKLPYYLTQRPKKEQLFA